MPKTQVSAMIVSALLTLFNADVGYLRADVVPIGKTSAVNSSDENSGDGGTSFKLGGVGLLGNGEMAGIEWSVTGRGILSFDWMVSSERDYDVLSFYEVGIGATNHISGTGAGWKRISIEVGGDTNTVHTFRWEYEKDPIGQYVDYDCGWVDAITWTPLFVLLVNGGSGSGLNTNGTLVVISADPPAQYFEFDRWVGDTNGIDNVFYAITTNVMPSANVTITATYKQIVYELTVVNGSGSGLNTNGTLVVISADSPAQHYEFNRWVGDTNGIDNVLSAISSIIMPFANATITATYKPIFYDLNVLNGSGSGKYVYDSNVGIVASKFTDKIFYKWTGDVETVSSVFSESTTLTTLDRAMSISATYYVPLTVNSGSGSGWYPEASVLTVAAYPSPIYMDFAGWVGDAMGMLDDASASTASLTMPDRAATLTATYKDSIARVSGSYGRIYTTAGTENAISKDEEAGSPSGNAAVKLGGTGILPDNGFTAFETVVYGSGSITFWWKTSSEVNDYLNFKVDGVKTASISGTKTPWTFVSNRVDGAGVDHTLRWEYVKNWSASSDIDAGWVDEIVWIGDVPVPAIRPDIRDMAHVGDQFRFTFWGERGIPYTVYSNATIGVCNWMPMDIEPLEIGELNGVFQYEAAVVPQKGLKACFFKVGYLPPLLVYHTISTSSSPAVGGTTSGGGSMQSSTYCTVTATPASGFAFVNWTEGATVASTSASYTFTVTGDRNLVANFAPDGMILLIPGGSNAGTDPEFGAYSLTTEPFYMDRYEVTKVLWDEVRTWAATNGYTDLAEGGGKAANHPVQTVSWYDCVKWCNARSQKAGLTPAYYTDVGWSLVYTNGQVSELYVKTSFTGYRLPSEVQWQYAARGGVASRRFPWNDSNEIQHARANYVSSSLYNYDTSPTRGYHPDYNDGTIPYTSPVGSFAANDYGLYDMAGNVYEWCYDWHPDYVGSSRVVLGGCWANYAYYCHVGDRRSYGPDLAYDFIGFRAVLNPDQP